MSCIVKVLRLIGLGLLPVCLLGITGCREEAPEPREREADDTLLGSGTAVVVEAADINSPSPLLAQTAIDINLAMDVMNLALLRADWEQGRVVYHMADKSPLAIARRYIYTGPDSTALRFWIRSDLKWSDGQSLTAHDITFTYRLAKNSSLASPRIDFVAHLDSVVPENDSTLIFYFERRYSEMLGHTTLPPVPRHVYQASPPGSLRNHPSLRDPGNGGLVISGPWRIGEWRQGEQLVLVPNPHSALSHASADWCFA